MSVFIRCWHGNGNGNGHGPTIMVSLFEDALEFGVPVTENATVDMVIEQLGKRVVRSFILMRNGKELGAKPDTRVQKDDRLILKL